MTFSIVGLPPVALVCLFLCKSLQYRLAEIQSTLCDSLETTILVENKLRIKIYLQSINLCIVHIYRDLSPSLLHKELYLRMMLLKRPPSESINRQQPCRPTQLFFLILGCIERYAFVHVWIKLQFTTDIDLIMRYKNENAKTTFMLHTTGAHFVSHDQTNIRFLLKIMHAKTRYLWL